MWLSNRLYTLLCTFPVTRYVTSPTSDPLLYNNLDLTNKLQGLNNQVYTVPAYGALASYTVNVITQDTASLYE